MALAGDGGGHHKGHKPCCKSIKQDQDQEAEQEASQGIGQATSQTQSNKGAVSPHQFVVGDNATLENTLYQGNNADAYNSATQSLAQDQYADLDGKQNAEQNKGKKHKKHGSWND
ncbi:hypothetical protein [Saccharopolyspora hordei]|uniref:Uncharacterized protein n=1 Tax=Saccharopolyspora hordei TaxID=1838 RepID=A0A853AVH6_9PSEU|nr:hypothetical protein [Saccharopolyspora hordei]